MKSLALPHDDGAKTATRTYFFSPGAERSEFQMLVPHFPFSSAFFSQTSQYLPRAFVPSFIVISYVPVRTAKSPDFAISTRVGFQLISLMLSRKPFQRFRMPSLVVTIGSLGGRTTASSA